MTREFDPLLRVSKSIFADHMPRMHAGDKIIAIIGVNHAEQFS